MKRLILIRGPAGVGKSTVGIMLKDKLKDAIVIDIDYLCHVIGGRVRQKRFKYIGHEVALSIIKEFTKEGDDIILEALFIDQADIDHVKKTFKELKYKTVIFTLDAKLSTLIENDRKRPYKSLGKELITKIYKGYLGDYGDNAYKQRKVTESSTIIKVDNKTYEQVTKEILEVLK